MKLLAAVYVEKVIRGGTSSFNLKHDRGYVAIQDAKYTVPQQSLSKGEAFTTFTRGGARTLAKHWRNVPRNIYTFVYLIKGRRGLEAGSVRAAGAVLLAFFFFYFRKVVKVRNVLNLNHPLVR